MGSIGFQLQQSVRIRTVYEYSIHLYLHFFQSFGRNAKQKSIQQIATELEVEAMEVSAKWQSLRTQFNRELAKTRKAKSGSGIDSVYVPKWEYFKMLLFLQTAKGYNDKTVSNLVIAFF